MSLFASPILRCERRTASEVMWPCTSVDSSSLGEWGACVWAGLGAQGRCRATGAGPQWPPAWGTSQPKRHGSQCGTVHTQPRLTSSPARSPREFSVAVLGHVQQLRPAQNVVHAAARQCGGSVRRAAKGAARCELWDQVCARSRGRLRRTVLHGVILGQARQVGSLDGPKSSIVATRIDTMLSARVSPQGSLTLTRS
jgi:hypothetical protein